MLNGRIKKAEQSNQIPRLGLVKIGEKDARGIPRSLDYFRASGKYEALFRAEFGEKPNKIKICFPSNDWSQVCNQRYENWTKGRLFSYGDGETFFLWSSSKLEYLQASASEAKKIMEDPETKEILTLRFMIPSIRTVLGYWQLSTQGANSSIKNLTGTFDAVKQTLEASGRPEIFCKIPFDLTVEFASSHKPDAKSRFPVLNLIPELSQHSLEQVRALSENLLEKPGLLTADSILLLPDKQTRAESQGDKEKLKILDEFLSGGGSPDDARRRWKKSEVSAEAKEEGFALIDQYAEAAK